MTTESSGRVRALEPQPAPKRKLTSQLGPLHLIAVVSGLLAFLVVLSWMRSQQDVIEVATAVQQIRSGNVITAEMIGTAEIPADATFGNRLVTVDEIASIAGSVATRSIGPGEPILDSDLRGIRTREGLRAMSVPIDINRAVSGDLAPGDRVDVVGFDEQGAHYIATSVEVLAVPDAGQNAFGTTSGFAVTLAVSDTEALEIAGAIEYGTIHILRSTGAPDVSIDRLEPEPPPDPGDGDT
jgi:Flp pilus assembly protein CpaB